MKSTWWDIIAFEATVIICFRAFLILSAFKLSQPLTVTGNERKLKRGSVNLRFGHNSLLVLSVSILLPENSSNIKSFSSFCGFIGWDWRYQLDISGCYILLFDRKRNWCLQGHSLVVNILYRDIIMQPIWGGCFFHEATTLSYLFSFSFLFHFKMM